MLATNFSLGSVTMNNERGTRGCLSPNFKFFAVRVLISAGDWWERESWFRALLRPFHTVQRKRKRKLSHVCTKCTRIFSVKLVPKNTYTTTSPGYFHFRGKKKPPNLYTNRSISFGARELVTGSVTSCQNQLPLFCEEFWACGAEKIFPFSLSFHWASNSLSSSCPLLCSFLSHCTASEIESLIRELGKFLGQSWKDLCMHRSVFCSHSFLTDGSSFCFCRCPTMPTCRRNNYHVASIEWNGQQERRWALL